MHARWPFPRRPTRLLPACVAALALLGPAIGREAGKPEDYDLPNAAWREGPVRYLLTKDEDDAFRALTSDTERARFIRRCWQSRDPTPDTPENEYRTQFYRRVLEANRLFIESPMPGWKTDRGKIYILLGPPDEQERSGDQDLGRAGNPRSARESIVWIYRAAPARAWAGSRSTIRFVRDPSGEYHLVSSLPSASPESSFNEARLGLVGFQILATQMKSLPEPREVLDTIVTTRTSLDAAPFRTHHDFSPAADGNTFTVLTVGVKKGLVTGGRPGGAPAEPHGREAEAPQPEAGTRPGCSRPAGDLCLEVVARLVGDDPGLPTYDLAGSTGLRAAREDATAGPDDYLLFQSGTAARPGRYTAYYGLVDLESNQLYSFKESVAIPDLRKETLELSSVTLASRLERLTGPESPGTTTPFVLGNLRVLPRPDDPFRSGEIFAFYYQVYGPAADPIDGRPDLDVEYQFFVAQELDVAGHPAFGPLGKPIHLTRQHSQIQGYSFPLKDWPAATYRLRILVTDNLSGRQSSREVAFQVR